jgi:hypothetical protein
LGKGLSKEIYFLGANICDLTLIKLNLFTFPQDLRPKNVFLNLSTTACAGKAAVTVAASAMVISSFSLCGEGGGERYDNLPEGVGRNAASMYL